MGVDQPVGLTASDDLTLIDQSHRGPEHLHLLQVVGRVEDGRALAGELAHELEDVPACLDVGTCGRLVQEQERWTVQQCYRRVEPALLASRELAGLAIERSAIASASDTSSIAVRSAASPSPARRPNSSRLLRTVTTG